MPHPFLKNRSDTYETPCRWRRQYIFYPVGTLVGNTNHKKSSNIAQWINYVVEAITHLKGKKLLDFAKSQFSKEI